MNTFVAFFPEAGLHAAIAAAAARYGGEVPPERFRWTAGEKRHLTYLFIGELSWRQLDEVRALFLEQEAPLRALLDGAPEIPFRSVGPFPPGRRATTLSLLPDADFRPAAALIQTRSLLAEACARAELPCDDRSWNPHMTLAYVRRGAQTAKTGEFPHLALDTPIVLQLTSVSLVVSEQDGQSTRYRKVLTY